MTRKEKIIAGIILGAVAGIGATLFFETERGKKFLAELKDMASGTFDDALKRFAGVEKKLGDFIDADDLELDED